MAVLTIGSSHYSLSDDYNLSKKTPISGNHLTGKITAPLENGGLISIFAPEFDIVRANAPGLHYVSATVTGFTVQDAMGDPVISLSGVTLSNGATSSTNWEWVPPGNALDYGDTWLDVRDILFAVTMPLTVIGPSDGGILLGGKGADSFFASEADDRIFAGSNDSVLAGGGDDTIIGIDSFSKSTLYNWIGGNSYKIQSIITENGGYIRDGYVDGGAGYDIVRSGSDYEVWSIADATGKIVWTRSEGNLSVFSGDVYTVVFAKRGGDRAEPGSLTIKGVEEINGIVLCQTAADIQRKISKWTADRKLLQEKMTIAADRIEIMEHANTLLKCEAMAYFAKGAIDVALIAGPQALTKFSAKLLFELTSGIIGWTASVVNAAVDEEHIDHLREAVFEITEFKLTTIVNELKSAGTATKIFKETLGLAKLLVDAYGAFESFKKVSLAVTDPVEARIAELKEGIAAGEEMLDRFDFEIGVLGSLDPICGAPVSEFEGFPVGEPRSLEVGQELGDGAALEFNDVEQLFALGANGNSNFLSRDIVGAAKLKGGSGKDVFFFKYGDGKVVVKDFGKGEIIVVDDVLAPSFKAFKHSGKDSNRGTVFDFGHGNKLKIKGLELSDVNKKSVEFVDLDF